MRRFFDRLLHLLRLRRPDADLARELDAHLALLQDSYEARGLSPDAARRAARLALGGVDQVKELHRDARSFRWIEDAAQDAAHGVRLLRRSPVFTATAALSLAIGIGANTAIFTVANALLFRPPAGIAEAVRAGRHRHGARRRRAESARLRGLSGGGTPHDVAPRRVRGRPVPQGHGAGAVGDGDRRGGARSIGHDELLHGAGRAAGPRAGVRRWRRERRGPELRLLDAALRRRRRRRRPDAADQRTARHRRRRRGAGLPGHGRPVVRRVAGDRTRGRRQRRRRRPAAAGRAARRRGGGSRDHRRRDRSRARRRARAGEPLERAAVLARGRQPEHRVRLRRRADGARLAGAGRGLRQRRRRHADPGDGARAGDRPAGRARRRARASRPSAADRDARALPLRRPARDRPRAGAAAGGDARAAAAAVVDRRAADARLARAALRAVAVARRRRGLRRAAGLQRARAWMRAASLKDGVRSSSGRSRLRSAFVVGQIACSVLLVVLATFFVRVLRHAGGADPGFDPRGVDVATIDCGGDRASGPAGPSSGGPCSSASGSRPAVESASLARVPPGGFEGIGLGEVGAGDQAGHVADVHSRPGTSSTPATSRPSAFPSSPGATSTPTDTAASPLVVVVSEALARRLWPGKAGDRTADAALDRHGRPARASCSASRRSSASPATSDRAAWSTAWPNRTSTCRWRRATPSGAA